MNISPRQYDIATLSSLGWIFDNSTTSPISAAPSATAGDSVTLGQPSRKQTGCEQSQLEQTLREKDCTLQEVLKNVTMMSGKYLQEYLDTGIVPSGCPGYQKDRITQTQDSLTSSQGMRVDVSATYKNTAVTGASVSVTRANGQSVTFETACDVRLNEREDGSLAVTFADTGETRIFARDGSVTSEQGTAGALAGTDGDDVFLQLAASGAVDAGNGNDSILVLASGGTTNAGDGDDTIVVGKMVGGTTSIIAGSGNDTLRGIELRTKMSVDMGEGNDSVDVLSYAGDIDLGQGNNSIAARNALGTLSAGDGNNSITARNTGGGMTFGNGDNQITVDSGSGNITMGAGKNTVTAATWMGGGITMGDGNNTINIDAMWMGTSITAGGGSNQVTVRSLDGSIAVGDGDNTINVNSMSSGNSSAILSGHGDNTVTVRSITGKVEMGDGNNTLRWSSSMDASINIGDGNNTVIGRDQGLFDSLMLGDGNNTLELYSNNAGFTHIASNVLGNGRNTILLGGSGTRVQHGSGNNTYRNWTMTQEEIQARNDANQAFMNTWLKQTFG